MPDVFAPIQGYSGLSRNNENKRQGLINLGLEQINAIFGGGSAPFFSRVPTDLTRSDWETGGRDQTYYYQDKLGNFVPAYSKDKGVTAFIQRPVGLGTGVSQKPDAKAKYRRDVNAGYRPLNKLVAEGNLYGVPTTRTFEGFQPSFYDARSKAYSDYALPQLAEQSRDAFSAANYGLANRGLLGSSIEKASRLRLEQLAGRAKQDISDEAITQAARLRQQVEAARQGAVSSLFQTADPGQATTQIANVASQFNAPPIFTPIADAFSGIAKQYLTSQLLNSYRGQLADSNRTSNLSSYLAPLESR